MMRAVACRAAAASPWGVLGLSTAAAAQAQASSKATFTGACFWCVEADFDKVPGVLSTTSGCIGGSVANPN